MLHFVNVLDYADAGKVDPHSPEDGSFDNLDLRHIRRFVQLDIRLRTQVKKTVGYAAGWDAIPPSASRSSDTSGRFRERRPS